MYQNYIFDLYGTLADIRTNEESPYLWRKLSDIYSALGAVYTARELKLAYRKAVDVKQAEAEKNHPAKKYAEPDRTEVFAELFREKGILCDRELAHVMAVTFRTLSRTRLGLYDGVIDFLDELKSVIALF